MRSSQYYANRIASSTLLPQTLLRKKPNPLFLRIHPNLVIEGQLVTTEPIEASEDILQIVDIYRARWTIEEFFKALKTGCGYEKRGLESLHALLNCLAIFIPIACNLYNLKMLARTQPQERALRVLNPTQICGSRPYKTTT